jgi:hypothetical protein
MKKTKKLIKDIVLLRAHEHIYIVLALVKVGALIAGGVAGYYLHETLN